MKLLNKIRVIAKAKFSDKSNLGDWYQKRRDICDQCPLNSINKENKTAKDIAMVTLNLGKPTCLACGCEISAKTSVRGATCGLVNIGEEPLWKPLPEIYEYTMDNLKIENLSSDVANLSIENMLVLEYKDLKYLGNSNIEISIEGVGFDIKSLIVHSGCGCVTNEVTYTKGKAYANIKYDSRRVGEFKKRLVISYLKNDKRLKFNVVLIGKITKTE